MKRRFVAIAAVWAVLLAMMPPPAMASEAAPPDLPLTMEETDPVPDSAPEEAAEDQFEPSLMGEEADGYTVVSTEEELDNALAQWKNGSLKIRLGTDISMSHITSICGTVDLDLGGHTLSVLSTHGDWSLALGIEPEADVTIHNGNVVCTSGETCAISVFSGTLTLEDVTVTGPCVLACTSYLDRNKNPTEFEGRIAITRCSLKCDECPAEDGTIGSYVGVIVMNGGIVESITDSNISGGHYGILVDSGSIGSISCTKSVMSQISGKYCGIQLRNGSIGSISGCEITNNAGNEENAKGEGLYVAEGAAVQTIANCSLNGIYTAGSVEQISNCSFTAPSGSQPLLDVFSGSVGTVTGCSFDRPKDDAPLIDIYDNGSIGVVEGNRFSCGETDYCAILVNATDTIDNLGENTISQNGNICNNGTIREVTAQGTWNEDMNIFTADSGWKLFNSGVIGELTPVTTEEEFLAVIRAGDRSHIKLGADIELSMKGLSVEGLFRVLDLDGHTLTVHSHGNGSYAMAALASSVYIRNGTVTCPDSDSCTISAIRGGLYLENVTVSGAAGALACVSEDESSPGRIERIANCQILGGSKFDDSEGHFRYSGIFLRDSGCYIDEIRDSTIQGAFAGIHIFSGNIGRIQNNEICSTLTGDGVGALYISDGQIGVLRDNILRTVDDGVRNIAVWNLDGGTIYTLGENQFPDANTIYSTGSVMELEAAGQWNDDGNVFQADSGWRLVKASSLPKLDRPQNLAWGDSQTIESDGPFPAGPGVMTWQLGQLYQNEVLVTVYQRLDDGSVMEVHHGHYWIGEPEKLQMDHSFLIDLSDQVPSGTYFFSVQALGDGTQYQSSNYAFSPDWNYVRPEGDKRLPAGSLTPWDGTGTVYTPAPTDHILGSHIELLWAEDLQAEPMVLGATCFFGSDPQVMDQESFRSWINKTGKTGYFYLRARTISSDPTVFLNSEPVMAAPYYYDGSYGSVEKDLEGIVNSEADLAGIQAALQDIGTQKLLDAMSQDDNDSVVNTLMQLDQQANVRASIEVEEGSPFKDQASSVSVVGAALNAAGENGVELVIGRPEKGEAIPTMYENPVSFSMTLNGAEDSANLAVPVQITLPVPTGINPDFLVVLHHKADGTCETVPAKIKQVGDAYYAVFVVTGFSDFTMVNAGVVLGKISFTPDGGRIAVTTGAEPVQLVLASYSAGDQMLDVKNIAISPGMNQEELTFSLATEPEGTVKAFVVKDGTWEPVSLVREEPVP